MLTYISYMVCDGDMCVDTPWRGHLATSSSEDMLRRENWSNNGKSPRKQRRWWCRPRFIFWRSDQTQSAELTSVSVFYLLNNTALQQTLNKEQKTPVSVCVCFVLFSDSSDFTTVWKLIWPVYFNKCGSCYYIIYLFFELTPREEISLRHCSSFLSKVFFVHFSTLSL